MSEVPHHRLICRLRGIAHSHGVTLRRTRSHMFSGMYLPKKQRILINLNFSAREVISTFFHELAHFLDHRDGKFRRFYASSSMKAFRRLALRAERHADDRAKAECEKVFPKLKFIRSYRSAKQVAYLKEYYQSPRTMLTPSVRKGKVRA